MTKKGVTLSILAAILAAVYVAFFTDWFAGRHIQIIASARGNRPSGIESWDRHKTGLMAFKLDGRYRLTSLKVVLAEEWSTNQYAVPLWHLVAEEGSDPVDTIVYGQPVRGMHPKMAELDPQPLDANVNYLLLLEEGRVKGRTNFVARAL